MHASNGGGVLCSPAQLYLRHLVPCSDEKADTHLFLHVADALQKGHKKVTVHTIVTDVVLVDVASFSKITPDELWIAFDVGSSFQYIDVHEIVATMNPIQHLTVPVLHAFTRCNTVSALAGGRKKDFLEHLEVFF